MGMRYRRKVCYLLGLLALNEPVLAEYGPRESASENTGQVQRIKAPMNSVHAFENPNSFSNEIEAVVAASDEYNPRSIEEDREYMGAILFSHGRYSYTVEAGKVGQDQITVRIRVPAGSSIVAFWHTHGAAASDRRYFSEVDTALAREWDKPFYLADYTGVLKVFNPGDKLLSTSKARRLGLPGRYGFSKGQRVEDLHGLAIQVATIRTSAPVLSEAQCDVQLTGNGIQSVYM